MIRNYKLYGNAISSYYGGNRIKISTQTGCKQKCVMCPIKGPTRNVNINGFGAQIEGLKPFAPVNNFILDYSGTGEPLDNWYVRREWQKIDTVARYVLERDVHHNINTIMPKGDYDLREIFPDRRPQIHYSLWSMNAAWRAKWMPNAMDPAAAIGKLRDYHAAGGPLPLLKWGVISGENDSLLEAQKAADIFRAMNFRAYIELHDYQPDIGSTTRASSRERRDAIQNLLKTVL